jgi:hypothetical protein
VPKGLTVLIEQGYRSSDYLAFNSLNSTGLLKCHSVKQLHLDMLQHNIDDAILCETWFNEKIDSHIVSLDGYNLVRKDCSKRKGGGISI